VTAAIAVLFMQRAHLPHGGVAGAAMDQPFADNPSWSGRLNWDPDERRRRQGRLRPRAAVYV